MQDPAAAAPPRAPAATPRVGVWRAWAVALRPRSLSLAAVAALLGVALAWAHQPGIAWGRALAVLALAALMQAITNLQNDLGPDRPQPAGATAPKIGWPRATALGWLSPGALRGAMWLAVACAAALAWPLWLARGWGVWAVGLVSLLAAWGYMGGPRPIAYTAWGEATVALFFGPVAVLGTVWALTGGLNAPDAWPALGMGAMAALPLVVNNQRDAAHDQASGRGTWRVVHGASAGVRLYQGLCLAAFAAPLAWAWHSGSAWALGPLALAPWAWHLARAMAQTLQQPRPEATSHALLLPSFGLASAYGLACALAAIAATAHAKGAL